MSNNREELWWNNRKLWILSMMCTAFVLSYLKPIRLTGGREVSYLCMFVVYLVSYFFGGKAGVLYALIFGGIKCIVDIRFEITISVFVGFLIEYGVIGIGGFWSKGRCALQKGFLISVFLRYTVSVCRYILEIHLLEGNIVESLQKGIVFCGSYILLETVITFIIISIPKVYEAIDYMKYVATHSYEENLNCY